MKNLILPALAASLMTAIAFPALAADPAMIEPTQQATVPPADDSFAAKRDTYLKEAQIQMDDWGRRVADWTKRVANSPATEKTRAALRDTWEKTEDASRRLALATEKSWTDAKIAFEDASEKLKDEWKRDTQ